MRKSINSLNEHLIVVAFVKDKYLPMRPYNLLDMKVFKIGNQKDWDWVVTQCAKINFQGCVVFGNKEAQTQVVLDKEAIIKLNCNKKRIRQEVINCLMMASLEDNKVKRYDNVPVSLHQYLMGPRN